MGKGKGEGERDMGGGVWNGAWDRKGLKGLKGRGDIPGDNEKEARGWDQRSMDQKGRMAGKEARRKEEKGRTKHGPRGNCKEKGKGSKRRGDNQVG